MAQSAGGHVVAVWHDGVRDRMLASASRTGRRWTRARVLAGHVPVPAGVRVALGPDGRGVVVWDENTGDRIHGAPALLRQ